MIIDFRKRIYLSRKEYFMNYSFNEFCRRFYGGRRIYKNET